MNLSNRFKEAMKEHRGVRLTFHEVEQVFPVVVQDYHPPYQALKGIVASAVFAFAATSHLTLGGWAVITAWVVFAMCMPALRR